MGKFICFRNATVCFRDVQLPKRKSAVGVKVCMGQRRLNSVLYLGRKGARASSAWRLEISVVMVWTVFLGNVVCLCR